MAFAPTVVASGSPARSRSLLRARSNRLDSSRLPSCASSSPHAGLLRRVACSTSPAFAVLISTSRAPERLDCSSRPTEPALAVVRSPLAQFANRSIRRTMLPFASQRSPLHGFPIRGVRCPRRCRHLSVAISASRSGCQPALRAAFVVRPPWRFLLPEPARVLHRAPVLGFEMFPRVLLALARLPKQPHPHALTALPHLAFSALRSLSPRPEQALPIARPTPGSRHPRRSPGPVHREPCPLVLHRFRGGNLGAFLPVRSRGSLRRCRPHAPAAPLGLPGPPWCSLSGPPSLARGRRRELKPCAHGSR